MLFAYFFCPGTLSHLSNPTPWPGAASRALLGMLRIVPCVRRPSLLDVRVEQSPAGTTRDPGMGSMGFTRNQGGQLGQLQR